jgi:hypothetical protein
MRNLILAPVPKLLVSLALTTSVFTVSCDSFEKDAITGENEVTVSDKQFYTLPNSSTVIDLKSIVKAYSNVTLMVNDEPDHGNLTKIGESIFNYRPNSDFTKGKDSFGIEISKDGKVLLTDSIIIIVDSDTTQFPCTLVAVEDSVWYDNSPNPGPTATRVWVLENDRLCGVAKEDVIITVISTPMHGIANVKSPQHILYEADAHYGGSDQFVYRISSSTDSANFSYGLVNISVYDGTCTLNPLDDFVDVNYDEVSKDFDLMANDQFCAGATSFFIVTYPKGNVTLFDNGIIRYTPPPIGVKTVDTLVYQLCHLSECKQAVVTINIIYDGCTVSANDDYRILSDSTSLRDAIVFPLDNDVMCGYQETLEIVQQPKHGWAGVSGNNRIDYTALNETTPDDTVRYKVCNSHGCSEANFIIQRE